jgi:hypothetical protein
MHLRSHLTLVAVAILALTLGHLPSFAEPPKAPPDDKPPDLASYLDLAKYYVTPVTPKKDAKTGFVVGGKNDTALIRELKEINGRAIADLEKDMRPGADSSVGSTSGFIGPDEKLLEVLATDNKYVVDDLGLTHQALAKHLHAMGTIGFWQLDQKQDGAPFVYRGRRFKVTLAISAGSQPSPFKDDTTSGTIATLQNLENGKKLKYALLVPYMIERYGFYEGKGTPYRVDPKNVVEVLDFLETRPKK